MKRWLTIALSGLVLSCQGPAAVMAREAGAAVSAVVMPAEAKRRAGTECADQWKSPGNRGAIVQKAGGRRAVV